jgi:hypothetical protein
MCMQCTFNSQAKADLPLDSLEAGPRTASVFVSSNKSARDGMGDESSKADPASLELSLSCRAMRLRSEGVRPGVVDLFARVLRADAGTADSGPNESSKDSRDEVLRGVIGAMIA